MDTVIVEQVLIYRLMKFTKCCCPWLLHKKIKFQKVKMMFTNKIFLIKCVLSQETH